MLTVSDGVVAGTRDDRSGVALHERLSSEGFTVVDQRVVADGTPRKVFQRVEELKAVGLTVPETTELLWQLRQAGVDVPLDALSDEECAQALFDLLQTRA